MSVLTLDCPDCATEDAYTFDLESAHEPGSERPYVVAVGPYLVPPPLCGCGPMNVLRINRLQELALASAREIQEARRYDAMERRRDH